jgi:hypothetical protein
VTLKWLAPYTVTRVLLARYNKWWLPWCGKCSILLGHTTIVATIRGGQQPVVVGGCTVADCWHATPALPVTAILVRRVCPLSTTAALSWACTIETREPSCMAVPAASSFILEARSPQPWDTWLHCSPPERGDRVRSGGSCDSTGVLLRKEAGLRLLNTWQHQNPLQWGGEVRSWGTYGSTWALISGEAGSGVTGHVTALEPSSTGRRGLELWDTWWHRSPPQLGDGVQSCRTHISIEALFSGVERP